MEAPKEALEKGRRVAVVLVPGTGSARRNQTLESLVSPFKAAFGAHLYVDKAELARASDRPRGASDISFPFTPSAGALDALFRPVWMHAEADGILLRFYEADWGDPELQYTRWEKLKLNFWLLTTFWNVVFHLPHYGWRDLRTVLWKSCLILPLDIAAYYLAEIALTLLAILMRKTSILQCFGRAIYTYAGDVKAYFSEVKLFHEQTKREAIHARFDEVMIKACLENDEVYLVAQGFGSVIAYDCLRQHEIHPSKMSTGFLAWIDGQTDRCADYFAKLKGVITVSSPLDKTYLFFPWHRRESTKRIGRFEIVKQAAPWEGGQPAWRAETRGEAAGASPFWWNVSDVSDPVGGSLELYDNDPVLGTPVDWQIAEAWMPSTAHNDTIRNRHLMSELARSIRTGSATAPPGAGFEQKAVSYLCGLLMSAANVAVLSLLVFFLLDLTMGTVREMIMDAESRTIFTDLNWVAGALRQWQEKMDISGNDPIRTVTQGSWIGLQTVLWLFVYALPFSYWFHRRSEHLRRARLARSGR